MRDSHLREILPAIFLLALTASTASAQQDVSRFELGTQFSLLTFNQPSKLVSNPIDPGFIGFAPSNLKRTEPGFGGRFTYNLTNSLAFEAEGNLFPRSEPSGRTPGGRVFQGQFGVKAGKRFRKFGIFGKARPGFLGFTQVTKLLSTTTTAPAGPLNQVFTVGTFGVGKKAYFSVDLGAVVEYYVSRRILARFDLGDTVIRYQSFPGQGTFLSQAIIVRPPETKHNLQFTVGVGFRF